MIKSFYIKIIQEKILLFTYLIVLLFSSPVKNAQNVIFGCNDPAASNYNPNATQNLDGLVEFPLGCNHNSWTANYVGINLILYQTYPSEFAVGTKVKIAGHDYWIDAMVVPNNCNAGVALIYIANSPSQADGNWSTIGGYVLSPITPGDVWSITECIYICGSPPIVPPDIENFSNGFPPDPCWDQAGDGNSGTGPTNIGFSYWDEYGFGNIGTTGAVGVNLWAVGKQEWILSPQYNFTTGGPYQIEFDFGVFQWPTIYPGTLGSDDIVEVLVSRDLGLTWNSLITFNNNYISNQNGTHEVITLPNDSGIVQFAFWASEGSVYDPENNDVMIDNFAVNPIPSCPQPQYITSFDVTADSASLTWTSIGSDSAWIVYLTPNGLAPDSSHMLIVNNDTVTYSGLSSNTLYDFYVQSICSGGDSSFLSGPYSVLTNCLAVSSPYYQNFDNTNAPSIDPCWSTISTGGFLYLSTISSLSPPNGVYFGSYNSTDIILVSPYISDLDSTKRIRFNCTISNNSGQANFLVGTMSDPTDASTFSTYDSIPNSIISIPGWNEIIVDFNNYNGSDNYIALKKVDCSNYCITYLDDFYYEDSPTCLPPTNLIATNTTPNSIDFSWTAENYEPLWNIQFGPSGFTLGTGTIDSTATSSYSLSNLNPSNAYDFYVQAICSANDSSTWTGPLTVNTLIQGPVGVNCSSGGYLGEVYVDDLEFSNGWTGIGSGASPGNWNMISGSTPTAGTGPLDAHSGNNYFYFESNGSVPTTPPIWGPANVNQSTQIVVVDSNELTRININHSDVHSGGAAYIKYTYSDGTIDEFIFRGNGGIRLWNPTNSSFTTTNYTIGIHSSAFMNIANTTKQYFIECTSVSGTNSWIFESLNTGLVKIELHENSNWAGLNGVTITESQNLNFLSSKSIISPLIDLSTATGDAELSFWIHAFGSGIGKIKVGVGSSITGPFTTISSITGQVQDFQHMPYQHCGVNLSNYLGQQIFVEFRYEYNIGNINGDIAIDLIEINSCFSCPRPNSSSFSLENVTSDSVYLSWQGFSNQNSWLVYLFDSLNTLTNTTPILVNNDSISLAVNENTEYTYYVQGICSNGDTSSLAGPFTFSTPCGSLSTFPHIEEFNTWPPYCWDLSGGNQTCVYNNGVLEASFWYWNVGQYAFLTSPVIDISSMAYPELIFDWSHLFNSFYPNDTLEVLISDDGGYTWNQIWIKTGTDFESYDGAGNTSPGTFVSSGRISLSPFGNSIMVRFNFASGYGPHCFLDNIEIKEAPTEDIGVVATNLPNATTGCEIGSSIVTATIYNFGILPQTGFDIQYTLNGVTNIETVFDTIHPGDSLLYTFNLPVDLSQDGVYNFFFTTNLPNDANNINDSTTVTIENYYTPIAPTVIGDTVCVNNLNPNGQTATLTAYGPLGFDFDWFDLNGNFIGTGDTIQTDTINYSSSYFAASKIVTQGNIGAINPGFNSGNYISSFPSGLIFDVYERMFIDSVTIYPSGEGTINIVIENRYGNIIYNDIYTISNPINTITGHKVPIGINLNPGLGYYIYISSVSPSWLSIYRNNTNVSYPYNFANIASITQSSNGSNNFYFYFYNWDVSTISCYSEMQEATVFVDPCLGINKNTKFEYGVFPNPNSGYFNVVIPKNINNSNLEILELSGKLIYSSKLESGNNVVNITGVSRGVYIVKLIENGNKTTKKLIIK